MPHFVSFAAFIAELTREKNRVLSQSINQSVTRPAYVVPRESKLSLLNLTVSLKHTAVQETSRILTAAALRGFSFQCFGGGPDFEAADFPTPNNLDNLAAPNLVFDGDADFAVYSSLSTSSS